MKSLGPFKEKGRELKYKNKWIKVEEAQVIRPDGSDGIFGLVYMMPGVVVVALDDEKNVWLVREYKYAIEEETVELISGGKDRDEAPEHAAVRELQEETGFVAGKITNLGILHPLTTLLSCPNDLILAEQLVYRPLGHAGGDVLTAMKVPFTKALQMIDTEEIKDTMTIAGLLRVARFLKIQ